MTVEAAAAPPGERDPLLALGLVLAQTFLVIFLGAAAVRIGTLKPEDARVVGFITGRVALPLLIFKAVATVEIEAVDFHVVWVVVATKLLVQLSTMAGAALLADHRQPGQRLLDAGIYGLYSVSSADFPIGFPVIMALFPKQPGRMTDYVAYLTLLAVAQDIITNIVALVALEAGKAQRDTALTVAEAAEASSGGAAPVANAGGRRSILRAIAGNICGNHLLWMVATGLFYQLAFSWTLSPAPSGGRLLPVGLREAVDVLSSPFRFCVLFQVGISVGSLTSDSVLAAPVRILGILLLNMIKLVILPLLMVCFLLTTEKGSVEKRNTCLIFILIYGNLPAPAAMVAFARLYGFNSDIIGLGVPVGLALSGPLVWVDATLGHLFMHSDDHMWKGDPRLEGFLQYPGLICGVFLILLFASGELHSSSSRRWRMFPMGGFVQFVVMIVGWHAVKLTFAHQGCEMSRWVHYLFAVLNQQVRLFGVVLVWQAWGLSRHINAKVVRWASVLVLYVLPLMVAVPALLGRDRFDKPLWIMSCLYVHAYSQRMVDLAACICYFGALVVAFVLFALSGGFKECHELATKSPAGNQEGAVTPKAIDEDHAARKASERTLRMQYLSRSSTMDLADSGIAVPSSGDCPDDWDCATFYRMFTLPALTMGLHTALLLVLDGALSIMRAERSAAWRAALSTGAALAHGTQGPLLLLLFCYSEPACRLYRAAFAWVSSLGECFTGRGDERESQPDTGSEDEEEVLSSSSSS